MTSIARSVTAMIPAGVKTHAWSLYYRKLHHRLKRHRFDRPSALGVGTFDGFEVAYRKHTADEKVLRHSFDRDIFLADMPEYQPAEDDVVIDVGAHVGTFALKVAALAPRGRVHAVEACEDSYHLLRINAALNRATNITAHHLALADKAGACTLHHDRGTWGHSIVHELSHRGEAVRTLSLADFMNAQQIDRCALMKLNCEGAEFPILMHAPAEVLARCRVILALYHGDLWTGHTHEDLGAHLREAGFATTVRHQTARRGWLIAVNQAEAA